MQALTTGPITRHLLKTTGFMLVTMLFQTLYFLIDLYWVGRLGTAAVAAVGIAGNLTFIVLALTQMLGVGTTAVISYAVFCLKKKRTPPPAALTTATAPYRLHAAHQPHGPRDRHGRTRLHA